jgi:hypothetical protein
MCGILLNRAYTKGSNMGTRATEIPGETPALRRLALQIGIQLPTDTDEAIVVLTILQNILEWRDGRPYVWKPIDIPPEDNILEFQIPRMP